VFCFAYVQLDVLVPRRKHEIEDLGELGNRLNRFLLCPDMSIRSASFPLNKSFI
jgi:hypothetical protein